MTENCGKTAGFTEDDIPETWEGLLKVCRKIKNSDSGLNAMTCDENAVDLLYGYQLARYIGQDAVLRVIRNGTWDQVPELLSRLRRISELFFSQDI